MVRPRKHPQGSTAADRVRAADEALRRAGGKRLTLRLSGEAVESMRLARAAFGDTSDAALIHRLLLDEGERARNEAAAPAAEQQGRKR